MKILFATSELAPWVKTGGLGDVAAALPPALRALGLNVRVLVPRYPALAEAFPDAREIARPHWLGGLLPHAVLLEAHAPDGTPLWLLDYPPYYNRAGSPYLGPEGHDWLDNHLRFGLLSRVAAWLGSDDSSMTWRPDIVHCNDWQTGLAPVFMRYLPGARAKSVITVHNLAFQGLCTPAALPELGLPEHAWHIDGVEYYGRLSFLKGGLRHADWITTVSPTYAEEIQTDAEGMGLSGLLRTRADTLSGIINGIDLAAWNPASDPHLEADYDAAHLGRKAANKSALQCELGLEPRADLPLLGIVSRLTHQKGLDLLPPIVEALLALPAQFAVLGSGEKDLEKAFRRFGERHPGRFVATIGFNEPLAHRIEAGADLFLMPSRFEPCGLNQMYSLRYGTPPVVRATGGLADTVVDADAVKDGNGFVFAEATVAALHAAIARGIAAWRQPARWVRIQKNGMARDFGWEGPARQYAELYRHVAAS
ncbi:MAG: glycogen synthase GlgA [Sulfurisoma sp.]|nr:glycogen synthase GlgA [Sulfurisoma sp.]